MPIRILSPQLANQIAAGEVVERPASVVKELVENSIDAGATRILIDIDRGGVQRIAVRDNGCGIAKDELPLALARHATSKIASLDDLDAIGSLGFRGEALASISSVARLTLTSRPTEQAQGWQAYAEGRDMAVSLKPAAHPPGSTLEVCDLFYNTPARRKFLRTEKTEFGHIDEVIRRLALAHCSVEFTLTHNGKRVRHYPAVEQQAHKNRVAAICGTAFMAQARQIDWQHGAMRIHGWVSLPDKPTAASELQYCYVNGRMIRDRLINHAIRQACETLPDLRLPPAFVLYLDIDPQQVDVNVHPAKHEVRFHQARLVHDFIYQGMLEALNEPPRVAAAAKPAGTDRHTPVANSADASQDAPLVAAVAAESAAASMLSASRPATASNSHAVSSARVSGAPAQPSGRAFPASGPVAPRGATERYNRKAGEVYQSLFSTVTETRTDGGKRGGLALAEAEPPVTDFAASGTLGRVLMICAERYALLDSGQGPALLSLPAARRLCLAYQLTPEEGENLRTQPLLIPVRLPVSAEEKARLAIARPLLVRLGIDVAEEKSLLLVRGVPAPLRQQDLSTLLIALITFIATHKPATVQDVSRWLARQTAGGEQPAWTVAQAITLLADLERLAPALAKQPPAGLLQPLSLTAALAKLEP